MEKGGLCWEMDYVLFGCEWKKEIFCWVVLFFWVLLVVVFFIFCGCSYFIIFLLIVIFMEIVNLKVGFRNCFM